MKKCTGWNISPPSDEKMFLWGFGRISHKAKTQKWFSQASANLAPSEIPRRNRQIMAKKNFFLERDLYTVYRQIYIYVFH